ncbi:MAG: formylglycine-generating enzyme family protein [Thermodesulfovibrionales bacterium]|nr:formylglycine-generating enzyme family protein [Nitrospinota bacterium]MCG2709143.1 formylglycine-generating enzyme family protein [Thermodesulfovibrionales bacterium]
MRKILIALFVLAFVSTTPPLAMGDKGGRGSFKDPTTGIEFILVKVKGGCFQMGDTFGDGWSNENPVHKVCVDDFYMGKYKVTQGQRKAIMGNNPSYFKNCDNCPVEQVSWNDVQKFINKLNQKNNPPSPPFSKGGMGGFRLPTEAEWEYSARSGGNNVNYAGTSNESDLGEYAWYQSNSGSKTHPVEQKKPNGLGIYDMSGNVWEWVQDWYDSGYYKNSHRVNPKGPNSGSRRVIRGGSWDFSERDVRASYLASSARRTAGAAALASALQEENKLLDF